MVLFRPKVNYTLRKRYLSVGFKKVSMRCSAPIQHLHATKNLVVRCGSEEEEGGGGERVVGGGGWIYKYSTYKLLLYKNNQHSTNDAADR